MEVVIRNSSSFFGAGFAVLEVRSFHHRWEIGARCKLARQRGTHTSVFVATNQDNGSRRLHATPRLMFTARYLCKLRACAAPTQAPGGGEEGAAATACKGCFSSPAAASPVERRAVLDAARIAGFADAKVCVLCSRRRAAFCRRQDF